MVGSSCNAELLYILESARKLREEEEAAAAGGEIFKVFQSISKLVVTLILFVSRRLDGLAGVQLGEGRETSDG